METENSGVEPTQVRLETHEEEVVKYQKTATEFADSAYPVELELAYATKPGFAHKSITKGLSKREYLAAAALTGLCANPAYTGMNPTKRIAYDALQLADQVLNEIVNPSDTPPQQVPLPPTAPPAPEKSNA